LRFYLSTDSSLDIDSIDAANDIQLLSVSLDGNVLHSTTDIGEVTIHPQPMYRSTIRKGLVIETHVTLNVIRNIDLRFCGLIYFVIQLDPHDVTDYDVNNNVIVKQVSSRVPTLKIRDSFI